jgi:hypothetical protein
VFVLLGSPLNLKSSLALAPAESVPLGMGLPVVIPTQPDCIKDVSGGAGASNNPSALGLLKSQPGLIERTNCGGKVEWIVVNMSRKV